MTARTLMGLFAVHLTILQRHGLTLDWLWVSEQRLLAADGLIVPGLFLHLLT